MSTIGSEAPENTYDRTTGANRVWPRQVGRELARSAPPDPTKQHPRFDADAEIPDRDVDEIMDLLLVTLNREMDILHRQSVANRVGLSDQQYERLETLGRTIVAAYRARPGRVPDPLDQREGETDDAYRARLETMAGRR